MSKKSSKSLPVAANEFRFTLEMPENAKRVWKAMIEEVHLWWPPDFLAAGPKSRMRFDLRLDGGLMEDAEGRNGVIWYRIIALDAPRSVTMSGFIAPPFGGPATTMLLLKLEEAPGNKTVLEVHNSQFGHIADCDVEAGWRTIFGNLAAHLAPA